MILDQLGINPVYLVAQIVNFVILFAVLTKFLYKPILKMLDGRAKIIAEGVKAAEENIKQRQALEETKKKELVQARVEVEKIMGKAVAEAKSMGQDLVDKAREEAKIQAEKEYAKLEQRLLAKQKEMQSQVTKLSVEMAKKLLEKTINESLQEKIFNEQLKKLKKITLN